MIFLLLGSTLAMLLAIDRGGRRWWVAYALLTCATAYTHYTAIFVIAAQFAWVLWAHPEARRAAIASAVAAAIGFLPWISGLKGDLDSPTTKILSDLSPFDLDSIRTSLEHWGLGYPYASAGGLTNLPGRAGARAARPRRSSSPAPDCSASGGGSGPGSQATITASPCS